uniref:Uncharacterized protein n=1 Tax=Melanopsichium pennsylvanicum 4 TaxID=1398559 RepID=A0A077RDU7_9BASI|nr:uncharacterized protein BN887_03589 [Melanopsichium pennsylvanicum 4]
MSSATVSNEAIANLSSIAPIQPAIASNDPTSIVDATTKSTTDTIEATIVTDTKPENVPQKVTVTGLTPDQVLQELKKSGTGNLSTHTKYNIDCFQYDVFNAN